MSAVLAPRAPSPTRSITLDGPADFAGFRRHARQLLAQGVPPEAVQWNSEAQPVDLFGAPLAEAANAAHAGRHGAEVHTVPRANAYAAGRADGHADPHTDPHTEAHAPRPTAPVAAPLSVPPSFLQLCEALALHANPRRHALMYRLLWRMAREPLLRHDPLDADIHQARLMAQAVRRDMHKMKAFVRFRPLAQAQGEPMHVAWFEPDHHIVEAVAPFFARRFANMRWAIFTPRVCVEWLPAGSGEGQLRYSPGASKQDVPGADAGEALWLTYYSHIFNPARLKLEMMQKEMPRKYWRNLPEAALIAPLAAQAAARTGDMVEAIAPAPRTGMRRLAPVVSIHPVAPAQVHTFAELRAATNQCRACPIGEHATQAICGEGPHAPALMFVGEQPGDREDLQGRPFVGPAGQLFDRALTELGANRDAFYIANAVKHFKYELRGKRRLHKTPAQQEAAACLHWLEREIELVQPRALVALGATAARSLLGEPVAVTRMRGQWLTRADGLQVFITLHPSALLRMEPGVKEEAYAQWKQDLAAALMRS